MSLDALSFTPRARGRELGYSDFAINGRPLSELARELVAGRLGIFGSLSPKTQAQYAKQLLLRAPSDFASGRAPLYICGQCDDLGCGALVVRVSRHEDCVVWSELGIESTAFGPARPSARPTERPPEQAAAESAIRDFWFEATAYERALSPFAGGVRLWPR